MDMNGTGIGPDGAGPGSAPGAEADGFSPVAMTPAWVPVAVVAGAVLLVEGLIVKQIRGEGDEGADRVIADIAKVSSVLGFLALSAGYFAFLHARTALATAFEAFVLSLAALVAYLLGWHSLLGLVGGGGADLWFVKEMGLEGRAAGGAALGAVLVSAAGFALAFRQTARIVWPYFRSGVALNVLAMMHLVVLLFGTVSALNLKLTPRLLGTGIDLTETDQFTLNEKTLGILGEVKGEMKAYLLDYPQRPESAWTPRTKDMLVAFAAHCPNLEVRSFNGFRDSDALRRTLMENGMDAVLNSVTGEEDVVVFGYRPPGEKLFSRTKIVPIDAEFTETTSLGNRKFRGEGLLANALNEVVFIQRHVYFTEGHGERGIAAGRAPGESISLLAEALRTDNFAVTPLDTVKDPAIPADADLVVVAAPRSPFSGPEVEALREYLAGGGALLVLLDVATRPDAVSGLDGLMDSWGIDAREDALIVSYSVNQGMGQVNITFSTLFQAGADEFGRHPAMEALRGTNFTLSFLHGIPVFTAEEKPKGVTVRELVFAPREIRGNKPFAIILKPGRPQDLRPQPGDIVDRRLPVAVAAERETGTGAKGGGRLVVFGDADFAVDGTVTLPNRNLFLNVASWAVRRDLIAIDPKTVETDTVSLRPIDRELAFWVAVVALPFITLGIALGVWWSRRR